MDFLTTITAHAGSLHTAANTPESFRAALAFPVDYLEADVCFTPENVAYLAHDALPQSQQGTAMRLADLLQLVAPYPTVHLNLDLKEYWGVREMSVLIKRMGMAPRVLLTGVTLDVVSKVREDSDGLPYLLNVFPSRHQRHAVSGAAELARTIRECGALGLNVNRLFITGTLASAMSAAGLSVSVWTVDSAREMRRLLRLPVGNITARRIDRLLALRKGRDR